MEVSRILGALPTFVYLAVWSVAVVLAVKMVRRNGGRAERFLLVGVSLMLASSIVGSAWAILYPSLMPKLVETGTDHKIISLIFSAINFVRAFISLGGIICLIYAFWQKFRIRHTDNSD
jgi:cytochrome bd-type quinol oxidase subunit 2